MTTVLVIFAASAIRQANGIALERLIDSLSTLKREEIEAPLSSPWKSWWTFKQPNSKAGRALATLIFSGAQGIPALLHHLRDSRQTDFYYKATGFESILRLKRIDRREDERTDDSPFEPFDLGPNAVRLSIGDICFYAVGQIVNRAYSPFAFQPGRGRLFISPVQDSTVAENVHRCWDGAGRDVLLASLSLDFLRPDVFDRDAEALRRIKRFFPNQLSALVLLKFREPFTTLEGGEVSSDQLLTKPGFLTSWQIIGILDVLGDISAPSMSKAANELRNRVKTARKMLAQNLLATHDEVKRQDILEHLKNVDLLLKRLGAPTM